jgi:hypothetical protein
MKETDFNEAQESKEENIDVKELLFKYLIHWPWFGCGYSVFDCGMGLSLYVHSCI